MEKTKKLSIVIPVLNEEENIIELSSRLESTLVQLSVDYEVVAVDNCSDDESLELLHSWKRANPKVTIVNRPYRGSFQSQIALGITHATGEGVLVIQSDLQDPPEEIKKFVESWLAGSSLVVGVPVNRHQGRLASYSRKIFHSGLEKLSNSRNIESIGFVDFYLLDIDLARDLASYKTEHHYLRGTIAEKYKIDDVIFYERKERTRGRSKFNFSSKYTLAMDAFLVSQAKAVRLLAISSFAVAGILLTAAIGLIFAGLSGLDFGERGWLSIVVLILFTNSLIAFFFAITFEYLYRILRLSMSTR